VCFIIASQLQLVGAILMQASIRKVTVPLMWNEY